LLLINREAHPFEHIVEFIHFNVPILVFINLVKTVLKGQTSLHQNLYQMVENLVLGVALAALTLHLSQLLDIVCVVELFEFLELDQARIIRVNLPEKSSQFLRFHHKLENVAEICMEFSLSEIAIIVGVKIFESRVYWTDGFHLDLNCTNHLKHLDFLVNF